MGDCFGGVPMAFVVRFRWRWIVVVFFFWRYRQGMHENVVAAFRLSWTVGAALQWCCGGVQMVVDCCVLLALCCDGVGHCDGASQLNNSNNNNTSNNKNKNYCWIHSTMR
jgi:hypothetical protein